ncbi:MAG: hypothetical protein RIG84_15195 [Roseovarius sp.]
MRIPAVILALGLLAACGEQAGQVGLLSEQDVAEDAPGMSVAAAPESAPQGGFLAALFGTPASTGPAPDAAAGEAEVAAAGGEPDAPEGDVTEIATAALDEEGTRQQDDRSGGFWGQLFGGSTKARAPEPAREGVRLASLGDTATPVLPEAKGDIDFGTRLPYGRVAKLCGVPPRKLGKQVAAYPERNPIHRLYDSAPGSTEPRTLYLTGFDDGCVRQFTAALAMFGSVEMHEQLRYGLPAEVQPYSDTDRAYEKIKRQVCGKPRRQPCGAKLPMLERDTVFVSVYERFEGSASWSNLLLHRGDLVAQDHKQGAGEG